jgi:hypothetical protein
MNPIALGSYLLACFTVGTAGAADVPPERMRAIYDEVKTPYKYGTVMPAPAGKKVDCPTVFRKYKGKINYYLSAQGYKLK